MDTPFEELAFAFPQPDRICALEGPIENHLGPLGITGARARSILALAAALTTNSITLSYSANPGEVNWKNFANFPGLVPGQSNILRCGRSVGRMPFRTPTTESRKRFRIELHDEILTLSQRWSPWRSYATILLWNFLANKLEIQKGEC